MNKYLLLWSNSSGDYGDYIEIEKELTEEMFDAICNKIMRMDGWGDADIIEEIKNKCIIIKKDSDGERELRERYECDNINVYYYN